MNPLPSPLSPEFGPRLVSLCDGRPGLRGGLHIEATAPPGDAPIIDFIASSEALDRYDEIICADGWRLDNYRRNPVFQNAHQYGDIIFTLGRALITEVRLAAPKPSEGGSGLSTIHSQPSTFLFQRVEFATDANPIARIAYGLYKGKFLNAVSVGFIPIRWENGEGVRASEAGKTEESGKRGGGAGGRRAGDSQSPIANSQYERQEAESPTASPRGQQTTTLSRPEALTCSRPEALTCSRPDALTCSRPEALTCSRPDALTLSRPDALTCSRPDALTCSRSDALKLSRSNAPTLSRSDAPAGFRRRYLEQELLEVSAVGIPANPEALALALRSGAVQKADLRELVEVLHHTIESRPTSPTSPTGPTASLDTQHATRNTFPLPFSATPADVLADTSALGPDANEAQWLQLARDLRRILRGA